MEASLGPDDVVKSRVWTFLYRDNVKSIINPQTLKKKKWDCKQLWKWI